VVMKRPFYDGDRAPARLTTSRLIGNVPCGLPDAVSGLARDFPRLGRWEADGNVTGSLVLVKASDQAVFGSFERKRWMVI
jgi:hypothetical protein